MKIFYYIRRFWEIPEVEKRLLIKWHFILLLLFVFIVKFFL